MNNENKKYEAWCKENSIPRLIKNHVCKISNVPQQQYKKLTTKIVNDFTIIDSLIIEKEYNLETKKHYLSNKYILLEAVQQYIQLKAKADIGKLSDYLQRKLYIEEQFKIARELAKKYE